jgi:hypothetical protein
MYSALTPTRGTNRDKESVFPGKDVGCLRAGKTPAETGYSNLVAGEFINRTFVKGQNCY